MVKLCKSASSRTGLNGYFQRLKNNLHCSKVLEQGAHHIPTEYLKSTNNDNTVQYVNEIDNLLTSWCLVHLPSVDVGYAHSCYPRMQRCHTYRILYYQSNTVIFT